MWLKQSKDPKGKEKCEGQAKQLDDYVKWLKENKGEKGKRKESKKEGKSRKAKEAEEAKSQKSLWLTTVTKDQQEQASSDVRRPRQ